MEGEMELWQALEKRRTVRAFSGPVPEELLKRVLLIGSKAPSPGNSQPWEFIHVKDQNTIEQIAQQKYSAILERSKSEQAAQHQKDVYKNATIVPICCKAGGLGAAAGWMATLNMALALFGEGYGSVTSTLGGEYKTAVEKILGIPEGYELVTVMVMGVPGKWPEKREGGVERPDFSWLHINKFGGK